MHQFISRLTYKRVGGITLTIGLTSGFCLLTYKKFNNRESTKSNASFFPYLSSSNSFEKIYDRGAYYLPNKEQYTVIERNQDGDVVTRDYIVHGKKQGIRFQDNGTFKTYTNYKDDTRTGETNVYDIHDKLVSTTIYDDDKIISQKLYDDTGLCINLSEEGELIAWKVDIDRRGDELRPVIIQVRIPKEAKRLTPYYLQGPKGNYTIGRVDTVIIESIVDNNFNNLQTMQHSIFNGQKFEVGQTIVVDEFNNDKNDIYGKGINVYLTKDHAIKSFGLMHTYIGILSVHQPWKQEYELEEQLREP
jgi:antitoxin component YwqK of YwqJK toxin-antitoxin module